MVAGTKEQKIVLTGTQRNQMQQALMNIVGYYFDELCRAHASLFFQDMVEIKSFQNTTRESLNDEFIQSLIRGLQIYSETPNENDLSVLWSRSFAVQKIQAPNGWSIRLSRRTDPSFQTNEFIKYLEVVFLNIEGDINSEYKNLLDIVANALQETTITIPQWLDNRSDQVAPQIKQELSKILGLVYQARLKYAPVHAAQGAYKESVMGLHTEISEIENHIWLPMHPPLTAPLEGASIENVYARDENAARRLARQIVKSDGIILISGYRGVGKSTFLNAALSKHVPEAEENQLESVKTKVVRAQINVAKASNIENVLRLCIRELHRVKRDHPEIPFTDEERLLIDMANLRTTFRVNVSQGEMLSHAKEIKTVFGFDPSVVFSKLLSPITLPFFSSVFNHTNTKSWQNKFDKSISLLDYDEDRAEEDLIRLVGQASKPREDKATGETVRLKLVFVFDELDKIPAPKQNQIVSRLKNLFLTPNCVFVLVTSKDFYYLLEEEKKKEDSLLGSYFSAVVTVPLFSATETENLIRHLVAIPIPSEEQIKKDSSLSRYQKIHDYLKILAKYLTYHSFGLPREIVRTLRENQQWTDAGLQPYITDLTFDRDEVRIFGKLQDVIEQVLTSESLTTGETGEISSSPDNELWLNDIRREQVRRGLYVLLDELRLQIVLEVNIEQEMSSKDTTLKQIYNNNFKGLPYNRFLSIVQNFGRKLAEASDEKGILFRYEPFGDSGENFRITVLSSFYLATNTQPSRPELDYSDVKELTPEESLQRVRGWFEKESGTVSVNLLLLYLKRCNKPLPADVQESVYRLLVSVNDDLDWRVQITGYLDPISLFEQRKNDKTDKKSFSWLGVEKSDTIVNAALDWATSSGKLSSDLQISILRNVLLRPKNSPATLTRSIGHLSDLAGNQEIQFPINMLYDVVSALDKNKDIPKELLGGLIVIAKAGNNHLLDVLLDGGFSSTSIETIRTILQEQPYLDTEKLWNTTVPDTPFKQRVLSALLLQLADRDELPDYIQDWLIKAQWTDEELAVLREISNVNKRALTTLRKLVISNKKETLLNAAIGEIRSGSSKQPPKPASGETQAKPVDQTNTRYVGITILVSGMILLSFLIWVYTLQNDANISATVWSRILTRTSEIAYLLVGFITIILIFFGIGALRDEQLRATSIIFFFFAIITGIISSLVFWWRYASADAPITFLGQISILGLCLTGIVAPLFVYLFLATIFGLFDRRT